MTHEMITTADLMKSVKAAWHRAPFGPKRDAALKHHQAAERAFMSRNYADTNKALEAATLALA